MTTSAELDAVIDELTVDADNDEEQLSGFHVGAEEALRRGERATIAGAVVEVVAIDCGPDARTGLLARVNRDGVTHNVALADLMFGAEPQGLQRGLELWRRRQYEIDVLRQKRIGCRPQVDSHAADEHGLEPMWLERLVEDPEHLENLPGDVFDTGRGIELGAKPDQIHSVRRRRVTVLRPPAARRRRGGCQRSASSCSRAAWRLSGRLPHRAIFA